MKLPIISVTNKKGENKLVEMDNLNCLRITEEETIQYFDIMSSEGIGDYTFVYNETAIGKEVPCMDIVDILTTYYKPKVLPTLNSEMKEALEKSLLLLKQVNDFYHANLKNPLGVSIENKSIDDNKLSIISDVPGLDEIQQQEIEEAVENGDIISQEDEVKNCMSDKEQIVEGNDNVLDLSEYNSELDPGVNLFNYDESSMCCFRIAKESISNAFTKEKMHEKFSCISNHINYRALLMISNAYYNYFNKEISKEETQETLKYIATNDFKTVSDKQ